ncbi:MAG TPA: type II toxin-antitoxin system VapC family toxin [Candidatus Sulfotelmatobacter sp.]|nr:type II toxin-antitoxin system VapC family toxin [Candidatus Sulfotelmatobacter sp.]
MTPSRARLRRFVLDANALISLLENRIDAATRVRSLIEEASRNQLPILLSAVNWGEVFYIAWRLHGEAQAREAETKLRQLPIVVMAADLDRATRAAALKQEHNLGYADAFAVELAIERGAWLVTANTEFAKLGKVLPLYPLPRHERA